MSGNEPTPTTATGKPPDEIEVVVDSVMASIGRAWKKIVLLAIIAGAIWMLYPILSGLASYLLYGMMMLFQLAFAVVFMIVQFVALFWFLGRGRTYWVKPGETGVGFADYKGNPEVLEAARRIVVLLRGVKRFKEMGGETTRGLLLSGPPGTGKSYLAQCIATEAGVPFGYASAPSFQNMFMGIGNLRVMMLYGKARNLAKKYGACILFIDEIDAIGAARSSQGPGMGLGGMLFGGGSGLLNELLLQMDPPPQDLSRIGRILRALGLRKGKSVLPPVLTMGATNLPEVLDPALLRPGRFDKQIRVDLPDADGRAEIIEYYLARVKHDPIDIERFVSDTINYTPVAIKYVINEAVIHAHFRGAEAINYDDITRAREVYEWGLRQPIKNMSPEDRRRLAYHEAGHALAQYLLLPRERVSKVTVVRYGQALGLSATKPVEQTYTADRNELLAHIKVSLASRAAEHIALKTELNGVTSDLEQATRLAMMCVGMWGMNGSLVSMRALGQATLDGKSAESVDKLLKEQFEEVKTLIEQHEAALHAIARELIEREELTGEEVAELVKQADASPERFLLESPTEVSGSVSAPLAAYNNAETEASYRC